MVTIKIRVMVNFREEGMIGKTTKGISEDLGVTSLGWLHSVYFIKICLVVYLFSYIFCMFYLSQLKKFFNVSQILPE